MPALLFCRASFAIVCVALTACGAPAGSAPSGAGAMSRAPFFSRPLAKSSATVVTSDASQNAVVICTQPTACNNCKTIGSGLSSPEGVTTTNGPGPRDTGSILGYVADSGNQRIVVFTDTCDTVSVLDDNGYFPSDVAVASDGTVAVTNLCAAPSCKGAGNIAFYAPGSTHAVRVATGLMSQYYDGAFDKHGNFYNDGLSGSTVEVGVVARGSKIDKSTGISGIEFPGGIQIAHDGTINVDDQNCPCVQIYKGSHHVGTVTLPGVVKPVTFALDKKNKHLWLTDVTSQTVERSPLSTGGKIQYQFSGFSEPIGIGVIPPAKP